MIGGGKYEAEATIIREQLKAVGIVLLVFDGHRGSGFSVQVPPLAIPVLIKALRDTADEIQKDLNTALEGKA